MKGKGSQKEARLQRLKEEIIDYVSAIYRLFSRGYSELSFQ